MYIGFDIGGTTIKHGILDEQGRILEKAAIATSHDRNVFYANLLSLIQAYQTRYEITGIGISAPGIIQKDGLMLTAGAIQSLYGENIKEVLEAATNLPVAIENDANAAAIAEKWIGNAQGIENYLCIVLGTGVGGGIVINGEVYRGAHGMAGEFGWMVQRALPQNGDIESESINFRQSIVTGLVRLYNLAAQKENPEASVVKDARVIFERAEAGEDLAKEITAEFYEGLSLALMNLISCYDPEVILIGGGVSANEIFHRRLQETLETLKSRHGSIHYLRGKTIAPVRAAKLQNDAGLIGAVYQIHHQLQR